MIIRLNNIKDASAEALIKASTIFSPDQFRAYKKAILNESNINAKWILEMIVENALVAEKNKYPLCDDTGIPYILIGVGEAAEIEGNISDILDAVKTGIAKGLKGLPGRPMAVKGNDEQKISQTSGLFNNSDAVETLPIRFKSISGKKVVISVLMLGGGPEIRSKTYRVFHQNDPNNIVTEVIKWAVENVGLLGCTPCVPAVGIGRTHYEATCLTMDAMIDGTFDEENEMERAITKAINRTLTGPLGIGGDISALKTFLKVGPQRASGVRIVNLRLGCCFDPRKHTIQLN